MFRNKHFNFYYKNVNSLRSIKSRRELIQSSGESENQYDFIILTETNLYEKIQDFEIICPKYLPVRVDRQKGVNDCKSSGGGVMIGIRKELSFETVKVDKTIEMLALKIKRDYQDMYVVVSYIRNEGRKPKDQMEFWHENVLKKHLAAYKAIKQQTNEYDTIFVFGDFNMSSIQYEQREHFMIPTFNTFNRVNKYYKAFMDAMHEMGLRQINTIPNKKNHYLDLIFTNQYHACKVCSPEKILIKDTEEFHTETVVNYTEYTNNN